MKILRQLLNSFRGEQDLDKFIKRGLRVGSDFKRMGGVIIDPSHCWLISIGDNVTLAPRVHILAHDASTKIYLNYTKIGRVNIGNRVFVGAGSIILPGVEIGDDVVIGAGSVVTKSIPANSLAAGNPARVICTLSEYLEKVKGRMTDENCFGSDYVLPFITEEKKQEQIRICEKYDKAFVI